MRPTVYTGCTRPMKAFPIGYTDNDKIEYKIVDFITDHIENVNGNWRSVSVSDCLFGTNKIVREWIPIPCGRCPGCLLNRSRQWRDRCIAESMYHDHNYFITLTYDDDHLPIGKTGNATLRKKDLQDFWKRLRWVSSFRYFACGEYGDQTHRPHYHALVFGLVLPDIFLNDYGHLESEILTKTWSHGMVSIGEFNETTAGYVSRYTYKKAFVDLNAFYEAFQVDPQFVLMSRKPGIGTQFFEEHGGFLYENGYFSYESPDGSKRISPTKFWTRMLENDNPELYKKVKQDALDRMINKMSILFGLDHDAASRLPMEILQDQEYLITDRTKPLRRRDLSYEKKDE